MKRLWPSKKPPVEVPPVPPGITGIRLYLKETERLLDEQYARIGNPFKWREFNRQARLIDARHDAVDAAINRLGETEC